MELDDTDLEPKDPENSDLEIGVNMVMNDIIDEISLGLCFEVHRSCKLGTLFLGDTDPVSQREHEIVDRPGVDVFGNPPAKKQLECVCPNCKRNLAASRFAPHLEKCMGMGRNSSRIASRRSQKVLKDSDSRLEDKRESGESDDDYNDVDWSLYPDKRLKRLKKEKRSNSPRRNKNSRNRNGAYIGGGEPASTSLLQEALIKQERADTPDSIGGYEYMTLEEKKTLLMSTCGVISGHTKKMCTRSHKCPTHTDEQRRQVRQYLLGTRSTIEDEDQVDIDTSTIEDEDQVDIDTYVDGDSQSLRESLQWEAASNASSPTDSISTVNNGDSQSLRESLQWEAASNASSPTDSISTVNSNNSSSKRRHGKSSSKSSKRRKLNKHHNSLGNDIHNMPLFDFE